jgi:hypothetical protein
LTADTLCLSRHGVSFGCVDAMQQEDEVRQRKLHEPRFQVWAAFSDVPDILKQVHTHPHTYTHTHIHTHTHRHTQPASLDSGLTLY